MTKKCTISEFIDHLLKMTIKEFEEFVRTLEVLREIVYLEE